MREGLREYMHRTWIEAQDRNRLGLIEFLAGSGAGTLLDFGCADGVYTMRVAGAIHAAEAIGIEIEQEAANAAGAIGVKVTVSDLNRPIDLPEGRADCAIANQVIEHLYDTDNLVAEAYRLLKPGGVFAISTENISAWYNVAAIAMGWQPFSLGNISGKVAGLGNPLALHRGEAGNALPLQHRRIFAPRGLVDLLEAHGFKVEVLKGYGYFPLGGRIAELLSELDPRHSAFIAVKARR